MIKMNIKTINISQNFIVCNIYDYIGFFFNWPHVNITFATEMEEKMNIFVNEY